MTRGRLSGALLLAAALVAGCAPSTPSPAPASAGAVSPATSPGSAATGDWHDPSLPAATRAAALLAAMTIDEKIGQMTQLEKGSVDPQGVADLLLGSVLSGGGGAPTPNDAASWYAMVKAYQDAALGTRLGIPILYGVDAVHGHNNVVGATIFPQQVGLGAAHDADLVTRIGQATAAEMAATGIRWDFGPVVAVPQDVRWGRAYEGYGEDPAAVSELATAFIAGLQGDDLTADASAAATAKHFVGDGGTAWGTSTTPGYSIDQGVNPADDATLRAIHLAPYQAALAAGARIVMASFSSTSAGKVHGDRHLLTDVLKGELGFTGFVVSDWAGVDQVDPDYTNAVAKAISAGIDMVMVPSDGKRFGDAVKAGLAAGTITQDRIDDAVTRILGVKFEMGLFERPMPPEADGQVGLRRPPRDRARGGRQVGGPAQDGAGRAAAAVAATCCSRVPARTTSACSPAAGRSRGRGRPGRPRRARPSPTTSARAWATGSSRRASARSPRAPTPRPASSSSPSRRMPRAWATPRRWSSRRTISRRSRRSGRMSTTSSSSSCPAGR